MQLRAEQAASFSAGFQDKSSTCACKSALSPARVNLIFIASRNLRWIPFKNYINVPVISVIMIGAPITTRRGFRNVCGMGWRSSSIYFLYWMASCLYLNIEKEVFPPLVRYFLLQYGISSKVQV